MALEIHGLFQPLPIGVYNFFNFSQQEKNEKAGPTFLTRPSHRWEAIGQKGSILYLQITIYMNMWNLGNFLLKKMYFVNNLLIKVQICKFLIHIIVIIFHTLYFVFT